MRWYSSESHGALSLSYLKHVKGSKTWKRYLYDSDRRLLALRNSSSSPSCPWATPYTGNLISKCKVSYLSNPYAGNLFPRCNTLSK